MTELTKFKTLFSIDGYLAVIPHIQNVYPPEKDRHIGWCFGFKYESGVFEFFTYKTIKEARSNYERLAQAIDKYYKKGG